MSAQAGVWLRDGEPIPQPWFGQIEATLAPRGPDGRGHVHLDSLAFLFRAFHITPEDLLEEQPVQTEDGDLLVFDGRLDNREQLLLDLCNSLEEPRTDARLALAALRQWGLSALPRLLGDWALTYWSWRDRRLHLARDYCGACPLYYATQGTDAFWSSEVETFLVEPLRSRVRSFSLNEDWLAGYLARGPDSHLTPYASIHAVPPGHVVIVQPSAIHVHRFVSFNPDCRIRYPQDAEYEEHFRMLFRQAVRSRLRSHRPIWAHLSGGLDSSSIVCMADDILDNEGAPAPTIETVSGAYDESPESDERRFIRTIEDRRGRSGRHFTEREYPLVRPPQRSWPGGPHFIDCFIVREAAISNAMSHCGARVQLCGDGGDEMLGNTGDGTPQILDAFAERRWRDLWYQATLWSIALRKSRTTLLAEAAAERLPISIQARLDAHSKLLALMLDPNFIKRTQFLRRCPDEVDCYGFTLPSMRSRSGALASISKRVSQVPFRRTGCVHVTYPYLDWHLITFLLSIPMSQLARPGERRSLMRRAMNGMLPPPVLRRRAKCSPDSALYRAVSREWPSIQELLRNPLLVQFGIVNPRKLAEAATQVRHGRCPATIFLKTIVLERWLRSRFGNDHDLLRSVKPDRLHFARP